MESIIIDDWAILWSQSVREEEARGEKIHSYRKAVVEKKKKKKKKKMNELATSKIYNLNEK